MGAEQIKRIRLKANASFSIREGWLTKGLRHVPQTPDVFQEEKGVEILGIGSAMVKSLRFWMQAAGLTVEGKPKGGGKLVQTLTELGQLIYQNDLYFEDYFSLCVVHYHIVSNPEMATVWYLMFNHYPPNRFTKDDLSETLIKTLQEMTEKEFAPASFRDDCATALKTYVGGKFRNHRNDVDRLKL